MTRTTSATTTLALLRPLTVLVATTFSPSLTPQLRPSANLKKTFSPTPGPQGLAPLTTPVITRPAPQGQANLTKLSTSPSHETSLLGVREQPNVPLPASTAQQSLATPTFNMTPLSH